MIPLWAITGLAGVVIAGAAGFGLAWELQAGAHAKYVNTQAVNARSAERVRRQNTETAAVVFEKGRDVIRTEYLVVTKEIENVASTPFYADRMCLDADGVRAANRAIHGPAADPGKPGAAVRAPAATP